MSEFAPPGQGKEVMALSILNLPVTLIRFSTAYQQNCGKQALLAQVIDVRSKPIDCQTAWQYSG
jgi:hypothetical protein